MPFTPFLNDNEDDCYSIVIMFVLFLIYMAIIIFINLNQLFDQYSKMENSYKKLKFDYQNLLVDFDEYRQEQEIEQHNENKDTNSDDIKKNQ